MTKADQLDIFAKRLQALLSSTASEYDLTAVEVIGVLECTKLKIALNVENNPPSQLPPP